MRRGWRLGRCDRRGYHAGMLPIGFKWQSIFGAGGHGDANALAYLHYPVARLDEKVGGGWIAALYYPNGLTVTRQCTSYAAGRAGCEAWAERHQAELIATCQARHDAWVAKQTWRKS